MIIIMEGCDRCGKSTQIERIKSFLASKNVSSHVIHYESIKKDEGVEYTPQILQQMSRVRYDDMLKLADEYADDPTTALIFDRAHLGEIVYAPLYRKYDGNYVFDLEKKYSKFIKFAIQFVFVDNPKNLVAREDGLSLGAADIKAKTQEVQLFGIAHLKSNVLNKNYVNIEHHDIDAVWKIVEFNITRLYDMLNSKERSKND